MVTKNVAGGITNLVVSGARHPAHVALKGFGFAKGVAEVGVWLLRGKTGALPPQHGGTQHDGPQSSTPIPAPDPDVTPVPPPNPAPAPGPAPVPTPVPAPPPGPPPVPSPEPAPAPDLQLGENLVAAEPVPTPEAIAPSETNPSPASRDAAHGGPDPEHPWEWDDLTDGPDVETPVGTTGAGVGSNPSTAEAGLQQPDTEPLMDPALTKAIKSESETMRKGAEREP